MVIDSAPCAAEKGCQETPTIDAQLFTMKSIMISPFSHVRVKGLAQSLPVHSCWVQVIAEPIANHWVTSGVMATNMYADLCPGSRCMGIVLRNLSAREFQIPPKNIIGNVETAEKVPNWEKLSHISEGWRESSKVGWISSSHLWKKR